MSKIAIQVQQTTNRLDLGGEVRRVNVGPVDDAFNAIREGLEEWFGKGVRMHSWDAKRVDSQIQIPQTWFGHASVPEYADPVAYMAWVEGDDDANEPRVTSAIEALGAYRAVRQIAGLARAAEREADDLWGLHSKEEMKVTPYAHVVRSTQFALRDAYVELEDAADAWVKANRDALYQQIKERGLVIAPSDQPQTILEKATGMRA